MAKIVVAIGGNALGNNPVEQLKIVKNTAKHLVGFIQKGNRLVIVHGNGPQVGMISNGFGEAHKVDSDSPLVDFPEAGAMSQGYIGYHLQQALINELHAQNLTKSVATIVSQVEVDPNDPGFKNPTKPIGLFMDEAEAQSLATENNWTVKEDAGRGWRRVIASPKPVDLVEKDIIKSLVDQDYLVICAGGGGVPVIKTNNQYQGVAGVIDKDFAAAKVAEIVNADSLIILTAVDQVLINYKKPNQTGLKEMSLNQAQQYIDEQQFAPGSMLPKVQATMSFIESNPTKTAYIGSLEQVEAVLDGQSGTKIVAK